MTIKVQLVGPMTGKPNFNYDTFDAVEQHLRQYGIAMVLPDVPIEVVPVNPANSFGRRQDLPRHQYLVNSLKQVSEADAICLLPGWQDSEGAKLEVQQALNCGLDFYLAWPYLADDMVNTGWATGSVSREHVEAVLNAPVVHTRRGDVYLPNPLTGGDWTPEHLDRYVASYGSKPAEYGTHHVVYDEAGWPEAPLGHADGFVVRDSGVRQEYASGMRRDTQEGKPDYTLIDRAFLYRWAMHMVKGKAKYGEDNWRLADSEEELKRFQKSALRHLIQWLDGEDEEDHAAAVAFNVAAAEYVKDKLAEPQESLAEFRARAEARMTGEPA